MGELGNLKGVRVTHPLVAQLRLLRPKGPPDSRDPRGEELVRRARGGDTEAWSRLYHEHFDGVFRHLRYLAGDANVAEELVQETFVLALTSIERFREQSAFSTWLHGIALNVARGHWRSTKSQGVAHQRLRAVQEVVAEVGEQPDGAVLRRQRSAALYAALEELPIHLREAFILRDLEVLSPVEASGQLGITVNNVNVRAARARQQLRRILGKLEGGAP